MTLTRPLWRMETDTAYGSLLVSPHGRALQLITLDNEIGYDIWDMDDPITTEQMSTAW